MNLDGTSNVLGLNVTAGLMAGGAVLIYSSFDVLYKFSKAKSPAWIRNLLIFASALNYCARSLIPTCSDCTVLLPSCLRVSRHRELHHEQSEIESAASCPNSTVSVAC